MKRIGKTAIALTAGGALALGGIAVAAPVLAGAGPGGPGQRPAATQTVQPGGPGAGPGAGHGMGHGMGPGMGHGFEHNRGDGTCPNLTAPSGTLTAEHKTALARTAEEEKLSHDLYTAFAARYDARVFDRIAKAETSHQNAVRTLLDRYGVPDPTAGKAAGQFASAGLKADYDRLLAQGSASEQAALKVGADLEKAQITELKKAADEAKAADVKQVYDRLATTSQRHLSAFQTWAN